MQVGAQLMLPDRDDDPAGVSQSSFGRLIPFDVALELGAPEVGVGLWLRQPTGRAAVPVAAVHEYRDANGRERDVRMSG